MSTGKSVGLVLILLSIGLLFLAFMFHLGMPFMHGHFAMPSPAAPVLMFIPPTLVFAVWLIMTYWVFGDAEKRGMNGLLWALLVFFGHVLALVVYLLVRNDQVKLPRSGGDGASCPICGKPVEAGFSYCPHCGKAMNLSCPGCEKPVEAGWQVCPYCGGALGESTA